jgi:hypothetical protein
MISNLESVGYMPIENIDVNAIPLDSLVAEYNSLKKNWIFFNVKINNEIATKAKFEEHSILQHLLMSTKNAKLIWAGDSSDIVLGGESNLMGSLLEYTRSEYFNKGNIPDPILSTYPSISDNVYTNFLLTTKAKDFRNTMSLLKRPSMKILKNIYGVENLPESAITGKPKGSDLNSMRREGLKDDQIILFFPFFLDMYWKFAEKPESDIVMTVVEEYFTGFAFYEENPKLYGPDVEKARTVLIKISKKVGLYPGVDEETFAASILANKRTTAISEAKLDRVYFWARTYHR